MPDLLEKLFYNPKHIRLLKVFFMNPEERLNEHEIYSRSRLGRRQFTKALRDLERLQVLKSEIRHVPAEDFGIKERRGRRRRKKSSRPRGIRERVYFANTDFPLFPELRALILKTVPYARSELSAKLRGVGSVKLALLGGVFVNNPHARIDLFLVADKVRKPKLTAFLRWLGDLIGRELNYALMSSQEFRYRRDLFDHFIREVLESPHEKVINALGI